MTRRTWMMVTCLGLLTPTLAQAGPLSLRDFFNGPLTAVGTVENLRDGSRRDFTIDMRGTWTGPRGSLVEDVVYADGERDHKVWAFEQVGDGRYVGRRTDVTKDAEVVEDDKGIAMTYKAETKVPAGLTLDLSFSDRFTRVDPNKVVVRSDVTYMFVSAATMTLTITKPPGRASAGGSRKP
jgi:hypothetical protein